jgi:threonine/homoserine/homoserine lactone efflux protein
METTAHHTTPRNPKALAAGFIIGVLWLVMAITSIWSAVRGYLNERYDWALLWGLVGLLLLGAGIAAMVGTWWHQTRIRDDY